jgi:GT2 family glycosyltransferase
MNDDGARARWVALLIAILNDDDYWLPGYLSTVVEAFERDPDVAVVGSTATFQNRTLIASVLKSRRRAALRSGEPSTLVRSTACGRPVRRGGYGAGAAASIASCRR